MALTNYLNNTNRRHDIHHYLLTYRANIASVAYDFPIIQIAGAPDYEGPLTKEEQNHFFQIEGNMDAEFMLVIAYPTPLTAYSTGGKPPFSPDKLTTTNTNEPYMTWLNYILAKDNLPQVISNSYGKLAPAPVLVTSTVHSDSMKCRGRRANGPRGLCQKSMCWLCSAWRPRDLRSLCYWGPRRW